MTFDNLYIISNDKIDDKNYKLLSYKENRNSNQIGVDLLHFSSFSDSKDIQHKVWNSKDKKFDFVNFIKLGNSNQNQQVKKYKM